MASCTRRAAAWRATLAYSQTSQRLVTTRRRALRPLRWYDVGRALAAGVAKTFLHVDGLTKDAVLDSARAAHRKAGDYTLLTGSSGKVCACGCACGACARLAHHVAGSGCAQVWGAALRSTDDAPVRSHCYALVPVPAVSMVGDEGAVQNPVFVSQGHRISLETSIAVVSACTRYRVPEPIRQADLQSREAIRQWVAAHPSHDAATK